MDGYIPFWRNVSVPLQKIYTFSNLVSLLVRQSMNHLKLTTALFIFVVENLGTMDSASPSCGR